MTELEKNPFDLWFFRAINIDLANPVLDPAMRFITGYSPWIVMGVLLLFWLITHFNRTNVIAVLFLVLAVAVTDGLCHSTIKIILARRSGRPCLILPWARLVIDACGNWFSFPSNHAANSMCVAVFWSWRTGLAWTRPLAIAFALLVGFSRIYVGVHFPTDVLAGALIGATFGTVFYFGSVNADKWLRKQGSHHSAVTQTS